MLTDFELVNFRTFDSLQLPDLGQVNLIVGKNNVGKTILLEALRLYASQGNFLSLRNLLLDRDEFGSEFVFSENDEIEFPLNVESLFHRSLHEPTKFTCFLGSRYDKLRLELVYLRKIRHEREFSFSESYEVVGPGEFFNEPSLTFGITVSFEDQQKIYPLSMLALDRKSLLSRSSLSSAGPVFVPSRGVNDRDVAKWWDSVALKDAEYKVYALMNLVAPIDRINFIENPFRRNERIPMVKLKNHSKPYPLKSFGDGMNRLFQIALALEGAQLIEPKHSEEFRMQGVFNFAGMEVDAKRKLLLIDEIENGIHYTAHPKMWEFILQAANQYGVQVFATSHSWDCINGLQQAVMSYPYTNAKLVRIEKTDFGSSVVTFDQFELPIVTQDNIEVR